MDAPIVCVYTYLFLYKHLLYLGVYLCVLSMWILIKLNAAINNNNNLTCSALLFQQPITVYIPTSLYWEHKFWGMVAGEIVKDFGFEYFHQSLISYLISPMPCHIPYRKTISHIPYPLFLISYPLSPMPYPLFHIKTPVFTAYFPNFVTTQMTTQHNHNTTSTL